MNKRAYIVVKSVQEKEDHGNGKQRSSNKSFELYVNTNGYHFTENLSEFASSQLRNVDGTPHTWSVLQVKKSIANLGFSIHENVSNGDIAYLANMYYSDFYPASMSEADCVRAAYEMANDPDGYSGMIFKRWLTDIENKNLSIDWSKFI